MVSRLKKARSRQNLTEKIMNADYTDDLALLVDTPAYAESILYSMVKAARDIGLYVNTDKTEFMRF